MKRYLLTLLILICCISCSRYNYASNESCYKVYKIKLNNEYYEIYAKQGERYYKIVSKKEDSDKGTKIKRGGCYKFELISMKESTSTIDGVKIIPLNYLDVQYTHPKNTSIKIDGGKITDLHYAKNLKGLYLIDE